MAKTRGGTSTPKASYIVSPDALIKATEDTLKKLVKGELCESFGLLVFDLSFILPQPEMPLEKNRNNKETPYTNECEVFCKSLLLTAMKDESILPSVDRAEKRRILKSSLNAEKELVKKTVQRFVQLARKKIKESQEVNIVDAKLKLEHEIRTTMKKIPKNVKDDFKKIGFLLWKGRRLPVIELGPYDIEPGAARNDWKKMFKKAMEDKEEVQRLVYWYGSDERCCDYSIVSKSKIMPYWKGVQKGYDRLPKTLQRKVAEKAELAEMEAFHVRAIEEMKYDEETPREDRAKWRPQFLEEYWDYALSEDWSDISTIVPGKKLDRSECKNPPQNIESTKNNHRDIMQEHDEDQAFCELQKEFNFKDDAGFGEPDAANNKQLGPNDEKSSSKKRKTRENNIRTTRIEADDSNQPSKNKKRKNTYSAMEGNDNLNQSVFASKDKGRETVPANECTGRSESVQITPCKNGMSEREVKQAVSPFNKENIPFYQLKSYLKKHLDQRYHNEVTIEQFEQYVAALPSYSESDKNNFDVYQPLMGIYVAYKDARENCKGCAEAPTLSGDTWTAVAPFTKKALSFYEAGSVLKADLNKRYHGEVTIAQFEKFVAALPSCSSQDQQDSDLHMPLLEKLNIYQHARVERENESIYQVAGGIMERRRTCLVD